MNKKQSQREEGKKKVLSLLTKDFQTINSINNKGEELGLYNNRNTYIKYLEDLVTEKKAVKLETTAATMYKLK